MQVRQEEEDVDKKGIAVGALALVAGLLASLELEGVALGWLVVTAPVWGGAILALVGATVHGAAMVGEALDQPTRADELTGAAWKAATELKRGKKRGSDVQGNGRGHGVCVQLCIATARPGTAH